MENQAMETRPTKQVIIIRRDLKMRRGKEIAQACHASMGVFTKYAEFTSDPFTDVKFLICPIVTASKVWLESSFAKICVYVESEHALIDLEAQAEAAAIPHCLIEDNGKTEFAGVKTKTALAIGPWWSEDIDKITGKLPLY